jgi:hypothetical protein
MGPAPKLDPGTHIPPQSKYRLLRGMLSGTPPRQLTAGDPGPDLDCRRCVRLVPSYIDISGGDWKIMCKCCNRPIKGLGENAALANEAVTTGREARRKPPIPKDKV